MAADVLDRLNAALAGRYRVEREIGAGGMATVYLAEDAKHHRKVAVKVLREDLGASVGAARFLREIEIAAQLQHPNILPLLDSGEADGLLYYVMPFVDGQSLRQRLAHDRELPIGEAVRLLVEIVDALAYAHKHGVVHRDIKPDNVMLSGRHALITDFGVARAVSEATGRNVITTLGVALGTPAYMAPEQATADPNVDHRADIYSAGIVAYELIAGRPPFQSTTPQQVLAAHVTVTPDPLSNHRPGVSPQLEQVVMKCLAKRPADRWQSGDDLLAALEPLATPSGGTQPTAARLAAVSPAAGRPRIAIGVAVLVIIAVGVWLIAHRSTASFAIGKTAQLTTEPGLEIHPAISPDGKLVAYASGTSQQMRIFIRPVGGGRTIQLTDDSAAVEAQPRWSPDGSQLLFLVRGGVSVVPALGGTARAIIPPSSSDRVSTATWSPDGREVAFGRGDSLLVVPLLGGTPRLIAGLTATPTGCGWSGAVRWIACVMGNSNYLEPGMTFGNIAPSEIVIVPSAGGAPIPISEDVTKLNESPVWSPDGDGILFVSNRDGPRDIYFQRIGGDGHANGPATRLTTGANAHTISITADARHIAYAVYASQANIWSLPIPQDGPVTIGAAVRVTSGSQTIESIRVSRDGKWIAYDSDIGGVASIYRVPIAGGQSELLEGETFPVFAGDLSPDGRTVAYHSWRNHTRDIEVKDLNGGAPVRVTDTPMQESYPVWSPDGTALAFFNQATPRGVYVVRRSGGSAWGAPTMVVFGGQANWMPDGRRLVVVRGDSTALTNRGVTIVDAATRATQDVYVVPPGGHGVENVSPSPDGSRIYFKSHDAVGRAEFWVVPSAGGTPRLLVRFADLTRPSNRADFTQDGKRFYFTIEDRQSDVWVADLVKR